MSYVDPVAGPVARALTGYAVVVTKRTVPVGPGHRLLAVMRVSRPDVDVTSNPEFLRTGGVIVDCMWPDRVVTGNRSGQALKVLRQLYPPFNLIRR